MPNHILIMLIFAAIFVFVACLLLCIILTLKTKNNPKLVSLINHFGVISGGIVLPFIGLLITIIVFVLIDIPGIFPPETTLPTETLPQSATTLPTESDPPVQWQYRKKIFNKSNYNNLDGWELYDTDTVYVTGPQSDWQYTPIVKTDSIEVVEATHYKWYTYTTETIEGEWSEWTTTRRTDLPANIKEKEKVFTQYGYYYFKCANCGYRMHGWATDCFSCGVYIPNDHGWVSDYFDTPWNEANLQDWYGTGHYFTMELDGTRWFQWTIGDSTRSVTKYAYTETSTRNIRTSDIYYSETPVDSALGVHSEPVTAYAYCTKIPTTTYYYFKWSEWTDCEEGEYQNDDNTQVQIKPE